MAEGTSEKEDVKRATEGQPFLATPLTSDGREQLQWRPRDLSVRTTRELVQLLLAAKSFEQTPFLTFTVSQTQMDFSAIVACLVASSSYYTRLLFLHNGSCPVFIFLRALAVLDFDRNVDDE
ncbi:hypothetical protein ElyMa_003190000 [Elysia marginata]|uniref:Uncharacterized protein n=1 Tax=Elysia marginata TaxID=1093978 RepID=A0AAV4IZG3_9GAST|nr:hypothetical protein ElyMa_003190000 [Elysia marginata]